jgi:hypothetical protein
VVSASKAQAGTASGSSGGGFFGVAEATLDEAGLHTPTTEQRLAASPLFLSAATFDLDWSSDEEDTGVAGLRAVEVCLTVTDHGVVGGHFGVVSLDDLAATLANEESVTSVVVRPRVDVAFLWVEEVQAGVVADVTAVGGVGVVEFTMPFEIAGFEVQSVSAAA